MERFRRPIWSFVLLTVVLSSQLLAQVDIQKPAKSDQNSAEQDFRKLVDNLDLDLSQKPISNQEQEVASLITQRVEATEWLGALAPVALSPFFGLTCLSGIAILGEDHLPDGHFLKRTSSPLRNPLVFLTFLALTILTSLPKFSKVSKPFAQAVDQVEAYSALIILIVIRFIGNMETGPAEEQVAVVYQAGFIDFSAETLLMFATVVNVIVINTVKFFFEVLIWITPIPFVDAIFEASNKTLCALLAAVYAFSPTIATIINLLILAACLLAFRWVKRREVYYRTVLFDFLRNWLNFGTEPTKPATLWMFPQSDFHGIPKLAKCQLSATEDGWLIEHPRLLLSKLQKQISAQPSEISSGLLMNTIEIDGVVFKFGKRHQRHMAKVAESLRLQFTAQSAEAQSGEGLAVELA